MVGHGDGRVEEPLEVHQFYRVVVGARHALQVAYRLPNSVSALARIGQRLDQLFAQLGLGSAFELVAGVSRKAPGPAEDA
jgi:hypothetical protein